MARAEAGVDATYSLGAACELTGLSPDVVRAWERRHHAVSPTRTPGGTRRYSGADLERLRLLKAAVDAGHRIGHVAGLDADALARLGGGEPAGMTPDEALFEALADLDAPEADRLLALQLSTLGMARFAREYVPAFLEEVGKRWAEERLCVASDHLASSLLRALLGSALRPTSASLAGPRVVFATPSGERHELGLLVTSLVALGAGANAVYLGPDLPAEEILAAASRVSADAVALSLVTLPASQGRRTVRELRASLASETELWIGGRRAAELPATDGVLRFADFDALEQLA